MCILTTGSTCPQRHRDSEVNTNNEVFLSLSFSLLLPAVHTEDHEINLQLVATLQTPVCLTTSSAVFHRLPPSSTVFHRLPSHCSSTDSSASSFASTSSLQVARLRHGGREGVGVGIRDDPGTGDGSTWDAGRGESGQYSGVGAIACAAATTMSPLAVTAAITATIAAAATIVRQGGAYCHQHRHHHCQHLMKENILILDIFLKLFNMKFVTKSYKNPQILMPRSWRIRV